ncbi:hypothetical protein DV738_g767, partial [Chaetothyriales sp. CBS 135597]
MGLPNTRGRPILPAPTDSLLGSADEAPADADVDVATDLSHNTDRSHQTLPDDGSPITVTTAPRKKALGKIVRSANPSQTSLLIEYFEHGPESGRKPSVRVKVTPSSARKAKERGASGGGATTVGAGTGSGAGAGHIVVTEAKGDRRPWQSHRIALGRDLAGDSSVSSLDPEAASLSAPPVEIEVNQGSDMSRLSDSPEPRYILPGSDISSMPPDSMLGVPSLVTVGQDKDSLKPGVMSAAARNLSNERIAQKVIEKISNKPRGARPPHSRSQSGVSRDVGLDISTESATGTGLATSAHSRTRSGKLVDDQSATGSSLVSGSLLSADARATDARSVRSGQSQVSVNNPKLLQTVEDVIRRLILPELKEIKKDQRHASHSKSAKEAQLSDLSESSLSRDEHSTRRHAKTAKEAQLSDLSGSSFSREDQATRRHSSGKSKRRSSRRVSSGSRRHESSRKVDTYDTASERSYGPSESLDSVSVQEDLKPRRRHRTHRHHKRDLDVPAAGAAALTAAALKHHDSASTLESSRSRGKKRSKSRSSRSASLAESEEIFHKHGVPPMPMRSEVETELTRSSLLSSNTATTAATPVQREQDLVVTHQEEDDDDTEYGNDGYSSGVGSFGHGLLTDPERARAYESNLHHQHPIRRGLSPIQSVASYATTEPNRNSLIQPRSVESMRSTRKENELADEISIASISSAPSTDLARSRRPHGISLENRSEIMQPHNEATAIAAHSDSQSEARDERRASTYTDVTDDDSYLDKSTGARDEQRRSAYTDLTEEERYLDNITTGRELNVGHGGNARLIHPSAAVESVVASLIEPSTLGMQSNLSAPISQVDSWKSRVDRDVGAYKTGSPLKHQYSFDEDDDDSRHLPLRSPAQSPVRSLVEHDSGHIPALAKSSDTLTQGAAAAAALEDAAHASPESEITTNPSVIQGPIAGYAATNPVHWPYDPPAPGQILSPRTREMSAAHANLVPEALAIGPRAAVDAGILPALGEPAPLGAHDEGYETGVTAANAPSPVVHERPLPRAAAFASGLQLNDPLDRDVPDVRREYVSGLSQGMSPLYDSATGRGIDRIKSKDVVALMDHLTVRDAQRSARDTEILMTLVTTAAEMRNSFEDMKKFITDQGDEVLDTADKHHDDTLKLINSLPLQTAAVAPPPPSSTAKLTRALPSEEDDLPARRRNFFRRAFRGLGNKNTQELQHIEALLMQLLDDVDSLKALHLSSQPQAAAVMREPRSTSITSAEQGHVGTDPGYEPEGQAGTSSTGDRSAIFSNNSSRQANYRGLGAPVVTANRVSTVIEGDEEYDGLDMPLDRDLSTTPRPAYANQHGRPSSHPLHTPPRLHTDLNQGSLSNEQPNRHYLIDNSPAGKKHKSFASSILPKMPISRWSKTTASSTGDYRSTMQTLGKGPPYSPGSQSGTNGPGYDYDAEGDDRLHSSTSLQDDLQQRYHDENRPPSPLIPSQVSDNPKYQAHRNSMNLQHPQPRQGPTERYQNTLENEAQYYIQDAASPASATSSQWENQAAVAAMMDGIPHDQDYQSGHGANLSPLSNQGRSSGQQHPSTVIFTRSGHGAQAPPTRPPKIPAGSDVNSEPLATYVDHVAAARAGSPAYDKSPIIAALRSSPGQGRKPSGPRPLSRNSGGNGTTTLNTSSGSIRARTGDLNSVKKTRFRRSPYHIDSD